MTAHSHNKKKGTNIPKEMGKNYWKAICKILSALLVIKAIETEEDININLSPICLQWLKWLIKPSIG